MAPRFRLRATTPAALGLAVVGMAGCGAIDSDGTAVDGETTAAAGEESSAVVSRSVVRDTLELDDCHPRHARKVEYIAADEQTPQRDCDGTAQPSSPPTIQRGADG